MAEYFLKYIHENLHKIWSLFFGLVIGLFIFAALDNLLTKIVPDTSVRFGFYLMTLLLWALYWEHYRACSKKNKKDHIGLVIAIYAESDREEKRLKADFISQLKEN